MSDEPVSETPPESPIAESMDIDDFESLEDDEDDFEPFTRKAKYPHETKIYFGGLGALLISAHLGYTSVWWVFAWSIGFILPGEVKKLHTYGIGAYVNKLHFDRPTVKDVGAIFGGLVLVFIVLATLVVGFLQLDMLLSEPGQSMLASPSGEVEGGHLLSNAVMNWWIYGIGVLAMFLIVGPAEELMFRHQLQGGLKKRLPRWKAIVLTNSIFALLHLPVIVFVPDLLLMTLPLAGIFLLGSVFSLQYEYTDNLLVPSLTHSTYNSIVLTALLVGIA